MSRWHRHETPAVAAPAVDPRMADAQRAVDESVAQQRLARRIVAAVGRAADVFDGIREHDHYSDLFEQQVREERRGG